MKLIYLIIFYVSILFRSWAFEIPQYCNNLKPIDCHCDTKTALKTSSLSAGWLNPFKEITFIDERIQKIYKANEIIKHSMLNLFRTMRDGPSEPTFKESKIEIEKIHQDFETLNVISIEILRLKNKFNICIINCTRMQSLEIENNIAQMQKMRMSILLKQPILANENFEKLMTKFSEQEVLNGKNYSNDIFEKTLKDAFFENLQKIDEKSTEYYKYLNDMQKPIMRESNLEYAGKYRDGLIDNFPDLIEEVINSSSTIGPSIGEDEQHIVCNKALDYQKYLKTKKIKGIALDASLLILPLLSGPLFPAVEIGVAGSIGTRLAIWGIREEAVAKSLATTSRLADFAFLGSEVIKTSDLSKACNGLEVKLLNDSKDSTYQELKNCQSELSDKILFLGVSSVLGVSSYSADTLAFLGKLKNKLPEVRVPIVVSRVESKPIDITHYLYKNGLTEIKPGAIGLEFTVPNEGVFTLMDLSKLEKISDPKIKKIPEDYWRFVGNIYKERLNLTPAEIEGFIKSSIEASNRTKLIINTEKSTTGAEITFRGGVGIVESKAAKELLPLEKATGFKIPRSPNEKIVEIVRLTASKEVEAEKTSAALISQVMSVISNDKSISRIFIYTSKIHSRLYRKMGIPIDKIKPLTDRDVLIEISREEADKILNSKILNPKTSDYFPALLIISSKIILS